MKSIELYLSQLGINARTQKMLFALIAFVAVFKLGAVFGKFFYYLLH